MGRFTSLLAGTGKWLLTRGAIVGGIGLATQIPVVGDSIKKLAGGVLNTTSELTGSAGPESTFGGFYKFLKLLGIFLEKLGVGGGIPETLMNIGGSGSSTRGLNGGAGMPAAPGGPNGGAPGGPDGGDGLGVGHTLGVAALGTGVGAAGFAAHRLMRRGAATPGVSAIAGGADDALEVMRGAQLGAADDVARSGWLSRLGGMGRWGKVAMIAGGATLGGAALLGGTPAQASTLTTGAAAAGGSLTANANNNGSIGISAGDIASTGLSIVGAKTAATAVAPLAASLGIKAIPGIAAIYAAGEGIYNTASYALKGEWGKAGLSLVSGVGETVAGIGGAATYLTVGTAWREAVRFGGAKLLGEENTIEHSTVVNAGSWLYNQFSGATTSTANAPAPQVLAPRAGGPALALG